MDVNCEGCAGCCIDWRPIAPERTDDHERRGDYRPLDDVYNLVPLSRADVRAFVDAGLADALTPRLWRAEGNARVEVDGVPLAAIEGKPVFFLGLRKPPKPVAPFGRENPDVLDTCVFLDPETLQCRVHGDEVYPTECAEYPGHNLRLDARTECERVESAFGGDRLLDRTPPDDLSDLLLGPQAIGQKVFVHPEPDRLTGVVERVTCADLTADDRAEFVAAAAAGTPGSPNTDMATFAEVYETARTARSWAGESIERWETAADGGGAMSVAAEEALGAPETPGWSR